MITIENKDSEIYVFGRKEKPYTKIIKDFKPYFYVEDKDGEYVTIDNKKVKKIEVNKPSDVSKLRNNYKHFEADVVFVNRFLIDLYHDCLGEPIYFPKNTKEITYNVLIEFNKNIKNGNINIEEGDIID